MGHRRVHHIQADLLCVGRHLARDEKHAMLQPRNSADKKKKSDTTDTTTGNSLGLLVPFGEGLPRPTGKLSGNM
eukprot:1886899-Amphidinium_carterae.1